MSQHVGLPVMSPQVVLMDSGEIQRRGYVQNIIGYFERYFNGLALVKKALFYLYLTYIYKWSQ